MRSADKVDALLKARAEIDEQLRRHKNSITVLFTDVVGSTSFFERNGDTAGLVMIHRHDELSKRVIEQHQGKVIKMIGDSAMAEFAEPASAVRASIEMQREFQKLNSTLAEDQRIQVRIGVHTGVGFRKGNDVFGDVVNVASRIMKRTAPAQILVSRAVNDAVSSEEDLHCRWLSRVTIDGRAEKEDVYEVIWTDADTYREMQEKLSTSSHIPPRYEALSQIGVGGTGIVYKVRDTETGEIVALKVLKPEVASDPAVQENFKRELCLARKITHKNVCRIHEFSRWNGTACTSMEYVEGESLSARLTRAGALPLNEAIDIARQICAGLREAHAQGIVHRDLKPANVMIDRSGAVKIMDFGIARMVQRDSAMTGTIVGTPEYMAPEQAELKALSPRTDIYALGLLLYEMVTGIAAFGGDTPVAVALKQIREYPKRPREIVPQISGATDAVIMKCLQKDAAKRFASVDALDLALLKALRARPAAAWEIALDRWLERAEIELRKKARESADKVEALLKQQDWSALARIQKEPMAMLGVAGIAGALTIFVWFGGWKPRAMNAQTVEAAAQKPISLSAAEESAAARSGSIAPLPPGASHETPSREISVFENVKIGTNQLPPMAQEPQSAPKFQNTSMDADSDVHLSRSPKQASAAKSAKSAAHGSQRRGMQAQTVSKQSMASASAAVSTTQADALMVVTIPTSTESTAANSSQPTAAPPAEPEAALVPKADTASTKTATLYLEVGSFKDEMWASNAADKLQELGYHTALVHKNLLWMQSYRVEVGPYASQQEVADAQKSLAAQGYKGHPSN